MEQKILPPDIASMLAVPRGGDKTTAEAFVREFFRIIGDALRTESIVKVRGLGTFKLVRVEARESINISTGQRFTIEEHTKISFTPDTALKNQINKPFSEFETIILNDDVDIDELDRIGVEAETNVAIEEVAEEQAEVLDDEPNNECADKEREEIEDAAHEAVADTPTDDCAEDPIPTQPLETDNPSHEQCQPEQPAVTSQPLVQNIDTQQVTEMTVANQHVEHQTIETKGKMEEQGSAKLSIWEALALMLFILCLMGLSYAAGYNHWLVGSTAEHSQSRERTEQTKAAEKKSPTASPTKNAQQSKTDSTNVTTNNQAVNTPKNAPSKQGTPSIETSQSVPQNASIRPASDFPQIDGAEYLIVGIQDYHKVKVGDSLLKLSVKYYGSKNFVKYIIKLNKIKNPDILNEGSTLKIPKLQKR